mgnify:CR=1 FL=1
MECKKETEDGQEKYYVDFPNLKGVNGVLNFFFIYSFNCLKGNDSLTASRVDVKLLSNSSAFTIIRLLLKAP